MNRSIFPIRGFPGGVTDVAIASFFAIPYVFVNEVKITHIDISSPKNPEVIRETKIDGTVVTSHMIDNHVHLVVQDSDWALRPFYVDDELPGSRIYETEKEYRAQLKASLETYLPDYTSTVYANGIETVEIRSLVEGENLTIPDDEGGSSLVSIVSLDLERTAGAI